MLVPNCVFPQTSIDFSAAEIVVRCSALGNTEELWEDPDIRKMYFKGSSYYGWKYGLARTFPNR